MVMTNAMGGVLASKRSRERDEQRAMEMVGNAMAQAAGGIAEQEMLEKDRRQQLLMHEEEKQYERKWQEDERTHKRFQADLDRQNKQHEKQFNMMAKVAGTTGVGPTMEEAAGLGFSPGEHGLIERIAENRSYEIANKEAADARAAESHERAGAESKAKVAESTARTGAYKSESLKDMTEAGKNVMETVGSVLRGGKKDDPVERHILLRNKLKKEEAAYQEERAKAESQEALYEADLKFLRNATAKRSLEMYANMGKVSYLTLMAKAYLRIDEPGQVQRIAEAYLKAGMQKEAEEIGMLLIQAEATERAK